MFDITLGMIGIAALVFFGFRLLLRSGGKKGRLVFSKTDHLARGLNVLLAFSVAWMLVSDVVTVGAVDQRFALLVLVGLLVGVALVEHLMVLIDIAALTLLLIRHEAPFGAMTGVWFLGLLAGFVVLQRTVAGFAGRT